MSYLPPLQRRPALRTRGARSLPPSSIRASYARSAQQASSIAAVIDVVLLHASPCDIGCAAPPLLDRQPLQAGSHRAHRGHDKVDGSHPFGANAFFD